MHSHSRMLCGLFSAVALCALSGCHHECCESESPSETPNVAPKPTPAPAVTNPPFVAAKWKGTWKSNGGHSGALSCVTKETGPLKWDAIFTATFGITMSYTVKLEGKPGKDSVSFGGAQDLGPAGVFKWTAEITPTEFNGKYEGGGDTGGFKLVKVNP